MVAKRVLDVRGLACPEPADQVLEAISDLAQGQYLEVLHYQEPKLFFGMLAKRGFEFIVRHGASSCDGDPCIKIMIWKRQDESARTAMEADL